MSTALRRSMVLVLVLVLVLGAGCRRRTSPGYVAVSNEDSGDVTLIDAEQAKVIATIPVGKRPRGMRASRDGKLLFVATSGAPKRGQGEPDDAADGIAVVDVERREVVRRLPAGHDPEAFDLTPDGKRIYVSNEDRGEVSVVDVAEGRVLRSIKVGGEPEGVTIAPDGHLAYVAAEASNEVYVIATDRDEVIARVPTSARPRTIAFNPDGSLALVAAENGGAVHLLDRSRAELATIRTGPPEARPMGVTFSPDGRRAFVTNGREGSIAVIDIPGRRVERAIPAVGARPWGIDITRDGKKLFVAAGPDVAVVDVARSEVVARIGVGKGPWGVVSLSR